MSNWCDWISSWLSISRKGLIYISEMTVSKLSDKCRKSVKISQRRSAMPWHTLTPMLITESQNGASSFFLTHYGVSLRSPSCVMCESLSKEIWQGLCKEKEIKLRWGKHINLVKLNADPHLLSPCSSALLLFPFPTQIMCSAHSEKSANFRPRLSLVYTGS